MKLLEGQPPRNAFTEQASAWISPHSLYGSPQIMVLGLDMTMRCRSVEPERHPAESRKIGVSSSRGSLGHSRSSSCTPLEIHGSDSLTLRCRLSALFVPKNALRRVSSTRTPLNRESSLKARRSEKPQRTAEKSMA